MAECGYCLLWLHGCKCGGEDDGVMETELEFVEHVPDSWRLIGGDENE